MKNVIDSKHFTYSDNKFVIEESMLFHLLSNRYYPNISIRSSKTGEIVEFEFSHLRTSNDGEVTATYFEPLWSHIKLNTKLRNVQLVIYNT